MIDKDKVHRVIKIESGKVDYVSDHIANDKELLLEYGYMLQPMPEADIIEPVLTVTVEHVQIAIDELEPIIEKSKIKTK